MTHPGAVFFEDKFTRMPSPHHRVGGASKHWIPHAGHAFEVSAKFYHRAARKQRSIICNVCGGSVRMEKIKGL